MAPGKRRRTTATATATNTADAVDATDDSANAAAAAAAIPAFATCSSSSSTPAKQAARNASRWDLLPVEVHRHILAITPDASPLLRYLTGCLSPEESACEARRIWVEALAQRACDVETVAGLPHADWAIPTATGGLCELRSRAVYEHLKTVRPDIAGWLPWGRENEMLLQVAMRNCWMDELEPFAESEEDARNLAVAAINYGHIELLQRLTTDHDPAKRVHPDMLFVNQKCFCGVAVGLGSFSLFVAVRDLAGGRCTSSDPAGCFLDCVQKLAAKDDIVFLRKLFASYENEFFGRYWPETLVGVDTWEWFCDVFGWSGADCTGFVVPLPRSVEDANRILSRTSTISSKLLRDYASKLEPEVFSLLWPLRGQYDAYPGRFSRWRSRHLKDIWSMTAPRQAQTELINHDYLCRPIHPAIISQLDNRAKEAAIKQVCNGDDLNLLLKLYDMFGCQYGSFILESILELAAADDDLSKLLWAIQLANVNQDLCRRLFMKACEKASRAVVWYFLELRPVTVQALWGGLIRASTGGHAPVVSKVWAHITNRDPAHASRTPEISTSLEEGFRNSLKYERLETIKALCQLGIYTPTQEDADLAVQGGYIEALRCICDAMRDKRVGLDVFVATIRGWAFGSHRDFAPVFDFVVSHMTVVAPGGEGDDAAASRSPTKTHELAYLVPALRRATRDLKNWKLRDHIASFMRSVTGKGDAKRKRKAKESE